MDYYWLYYVATMLTVVMSRNPLLLAVILAFFILRPWLPDPVVLSSTLTRIGSLKSQVRLNPANVPARVHLAQAYLDLLRPRAALEHLTAARTRDGKNVDVAYLRGLAHLRIGDDESALSSFAEALGIDPDSGEPMSSKRAGKVTHARIGDVYLATATALERMQRWPQAEEALLASTGCNSSAIEPLLRIARIRRNQGDREGAWEAVQDAKRTWESLPSYTRRSQLSWGARLTLARLLGK